MRRVGGEGPAARQPAAASVRSFPTALKLASASRAAARSTPVGDTSSFLWKLTGLLTYMSIHDLFENVAVRGVLIPVEPMMQLNR